MLDERNTTICTELLVLRIMAVYFWVMMTWRVPADPCGC